MRNDLADSPPLRPDFQIQIQRKGLIGISYSFADAALFRVPQG